MILIHTCIIHYLHDIKCIKSVCDERHLVWKEGFSMYIKIN